MSAPRRPPLAPFLILAVGLVCAAPDGAVGGGLFLIDGVGLQGRLEIGMRAPQDRGAVRDHPGWLILDDGPLWFAKTTEGQVALIRCNKQCLTNRGVATGSRRQEVLSAYGNPVEERPLEGKQFLSYRGAGFLLDGDTVVAIFILPDVAKK